jgi:hypothetical protein
LGWKTSGSLSSSMRLGGVWLMSAQSHTGDTAVLNTYGAERLLEQGDQRAVFTATREEVHTTVTLSAIRSVLYGCVCLALIHDRPHSSTVMWAGTVSKTACV